MFDSLAMDLSIDYYVYEEDGVTTQPVDVYTLTEDNIVLRIYYTAPTLHSNQ